MAAAEAGGASLSLSHLVAGNEMIAPQDNKRRLVFPSHSLPSSVSGWPATLSWLKLVGLLFFFSLE